MHQFRSFKVLIQENWQQVFSEWTLLQNEDTLRLCGYVFYRLTVNKRIKTSTFTLRASHKALRFLSLHQKSFQVPAAPHNPPVMHQNTHLPPPNNTFMPQCCCSPFLNAGSDVGAEDRWRHAVFRFSHTGTLYCSGWRQKNIFFILFELCNKFHMWCLLI